MQVRLLHRWLCRAVLAATLSFASGAGAQPLDLDDPRPREIAVRFERSPRSTPAALDAIYSDPVPARFKRLSDGRVRIAIDGALVASQLFAGEHTKPESFDDFVWILDPSTREVVDARLEGVLEQSIDWGFTTSVTEARVRVRMSTREPAGYRAAKRILGKHVFRHCNPRVEPEGGDCERVAAVRFDPERGYVNAVGVIEVETPLGFSAIAFSPLGEAIFLEAENAGLEPVAASGPAVFVGFEIAAPAPRAD